MRYKTIVDKNDDGLMEIIRAVEQFEEDRFLASLTVRRHTMHDIQEATLTVREYQAKMNREVLALAKFSETFIQEYATDNNQCFETSQRLFNRIRSTISATRRVFRKTCPIVRRLAPDRPSIFHRSVLSFGNCQRDLFGVSSYEDAVHVLYEDLQTFFTTVISTLVLCRRMLQKEAAVREDESLCLAIYRECREKALEGVKELSDALEMTALPETELLLRKRKAKSLTLYARENYHKVGVTEFKMTVLAEAVLQGRSSGLTADETRLWPNDYDKALRVREVIGLLDRLEDAEGRRGKLDGSMMVEFIKWCGVPKEMERNMYETYFSATYQGTLARLSWNTVCKVRKEHQDLGISDAEECASFDKRLSRMDAQG